MFSSKFTFKFLFLVLLTGIAFGQPNSVQVKSGDGILISSHESITAAYNSLPSEIVQAYVMEILPEYNAVSEIFPIEITARTGASAVNNITLRPAEDNYNAVISKALNNNPIINLNGAKYFVLDGRPGGVGDSSGLLIENTLNVGAKTNTINFIDGASYNTVRYVVAKSVPRSNAGPRNIHFSSSNIGNTSNNIIEFCKVLGGRSGISFSGISSGLNTGNIIRNTKIYNFGLAGIWMVGAAENTVIRDCEIFQQESGLNTSFVGGILLEPSGTRGTTDIINNKIYGLKHNSLLDSAAAWGILGSGDNGSTLNIINNFIALPDDNQNTKSTHGIFINNSTQFTCNIFFNTVRIGGLQANTLFGGQILSSAVTKSNSNASSVFNVFNNIFINTRTGGNGNHVGGHFANTTGTLTINYNCYFSEQAAPAYHAVWGNSLFSSLPDYLNAAFPNEQNSIFKDVNFASNTDLHIAGTSIGDMDLAALPISLNYDIDYDFRDVIYPYKGADEADALPVELSSFTASVSENNVTLSWITKTEANNSGFEIQRMNVSGTWNTISFVKGTGTSTDETIYTFADQNLSEGRYNYRLKQIDFGGSYTFYNLSETIEIMNPALYSLSQNYPNPFNPATVIEYTLPETGFVNLTVYSITGEEVVSMVNNTQSAGSYKVDFNASSLSSGMYIYSLKVNDFVSVKKMTLLR